MTQIKKFGILQTAKVITYCCSATFQIIVVLSGFVYLVVLEGDLTSLANFLSGYGLGPPEPMWPFKLYVIVGAAFGILSWVTTVIFCFMYNRVASRIGGIQIELGTE